MHLRAFSEPSPSCTRGNKKSTGILEPAPRSLIGQKVASTPVGLCRLVYGVLLEDLNPGLGRPPGLGVGTGLGNSFEMEIANSIEVHEG